MTEIPSWVFDAIVEAGATQAIVSFSGGNDEGGADAITLTKPSAEGGHEIVAELEPHPDTGEGLAAFLSDLPSTRYSFLGEPYVDGTIVLDATDKRNARWDVVEETEEEAYG